MGRARREHGRVDQLFARPQAGQRIEAVGQRLAEHHDIRRHAEVFDRPQLAGPPETHLDFIGHHQDAVLVEHLLQALEEARRRDHVAAGALNGFHVERGVFALVGLRVPHAVVFGLEQALELAHAAVGILFRRHPLRATERIRERQEHRALAEVAEAATVAVARRDRRGAQRAAVVAAFEGEHQALAVAGVAHDLERILDRLRTADVEMHAAIQTELLFRVDRDGLGQLDARLVQVLAGHLRQQVDLVFQHVVQTLVGVAEVDRRIPHLQVKERRARGIEHVAAFAAAEDLRRVNIMHGIAERAVLGLVGQQLGVVDDDLGVFVEGIHEREVRENSEGVSGWKAQRSGSSAGPRAARSIRHRDQYRTMLTAG